MRIRPMTDSWMMSFGGQGNTEGWSICAADRSLAMPDIRFGRAAWTTLFVTWGDDVPGLHAVVGAPLPGQVSIPGDPGGGATDLGRLVVDDGLRLEHPAGARRVTGIPAGRYRVWFRARAADVSAVSDEEHFSAVVTLGLHLSALEAPDPPEFRQDGEALNLRLDELGLVLCDPPIVDRVLQQRQDLVRRQGGILDAIAGSSLAEELLDSGAFLPVWGMRPWVYRVASGGVRSTVCPLGHRVGEPVTLHASGFRAGVHVVPGGVLRGADTVDWGRWPVLGLRGAGPALRLSTFVTGGPEPLDPDRSVGILATIWLSRCAEPPEEPNSLHYLLADFNPLNACETDAGEGHAGDTWPGERASLWAGEPADL